MKITKMLVRRGRIYEVRFDDGTYINLDKTYADGKGIAEGMEISDSLSLQMEDESDSIRCRNRAMYYLSRSDLTEKALKEKLKKAGFEERFIKDTINRFKELSYINDNEFCLRYAQKYQESNLSYRQLVEKMVKLGIQRNTAKEFLSYESRLEQQKILNLINTKYKGKLHCPNEIRKTTASLLRCGFAFCDIRAVLKEYDQTLALTTEE